MYCGRWDIIVRALYGAKSSAASWRFCISKVIEGMGFKMCRADNDVWIRPAQNAEGMDVYEYILVYSDDLLMIGLNPHEMAVQIEASYKLKEGQYWAVLA